MLYSLQNLKKENGKRLVLDIPTLDIPTGGTYVLQGANGAGKTTLLHILAFLAAPCEGAILFGGRRVDFTDRNLRSLRREVTLLHQAPYLFDRSVYCNVAFGPDIRGIKGDQQRKLVADALAMVGLPAFENRHARDLSGGEIQRVALARALAIKPQVLLLDEPMSNVDGESAQLIEKVIKSLPAQGTTVILASHDHLLPKRLGAQVIKLVAGRVLENQGPNSMTFGERRYANL